jgi:excisionase family DNA binding protein
MTGAQVELEILTPPEVAAYLRLGRSTIYRLLERREIPGYKVAGRWRCYRVELDTWVRTSGPAGQQAHPGAKHPRHRPERDSLLADVDELRNTQ